MDAESQKLLAQSVNDLNGLMEEMDKSVDDPGEGEIRSKGNVQLARELGEFGIRVAKVEDAARRAKDFLDNLKAKKIVALVEQGIAIGRTEALVKVDADFLKAQEQLRKLEHSEDVLQRKSKSGWAYLDQSRSRLSWVSKDRSA